MTRNPGGRTRIAIGLLVSLVAHAAAIAVVSIEIPTPAPSPVLTWVEATPSPPESEPEKPLQVYEIRPPGMSLPSGGSAAATKQADDGGGAVVIAPPAAAASPRLDAPGSSSIELAPKASPVEVSPIVLAAAPAGGADDESTEKARRPGRGVVLRAEGSSGETGASGRGTTGRGFGGSTGGVTIIGPGGDCITPGSGTPTGLGLPGGPTPFAGNGGRATRGRVGGGLPRIGRGR